MRSISLTFKQFAKPVLLAIGLVIWGFSTYAQGDAAKGKEIFDAKCTACHKVESRVIGPALGPQMTSETDDKYLIHWIQNNQALIAAKDPKALKIYNEFNQAYMTVFTDLSDADVTNIITFVRADWKDKQAATAKGPVGGAPVEKGPSDIMIFGLIGVIIIAFIIILVLNKVIRTLERVMLNRPEAFIVEAVEVVPVDKYATVKKLLKNKKFDFIVLLCVSIAGARWTWMTMLNTDVHQGFQPVQPINFPHDLHAGAMQIICQYCHSGAFKSKNASIPSLNFCMNCHKTVKTESPEIHKIYDALGYDPQTQKYDTTKAHPIQWIRVHNLPDLVYFNHSQHVKVAGLACQTCHGPVQTMKEDYQYSPLTMKWCIQCHKRTGINYKYNGYYDKMEAIHDRIKLGDKITEAEMGGIECGKCHY